ncbi:HpcH/HpaI aldolase/citrate lyase family protein [Sphingosinicella humi]|uniref:CoA ester lyase n=1 Tax=Allosphingosinicella humi TaxID=2068657 RepID=A0A2U2IZP6_9SPHN|nr:CoA ester lyase [Sphingosinicella humi]PWG01537.1 CoA ester lyase [Sphingosinicella humi]
MRLRSLLFVPGDRPDRMEKALGAGADALILDLEDAVAPERKAEARDAVLAFLARDRTVPLFVRINPLDTELANEDLIVVRERPEGIVLPKCESFEDVRRLEMRLDFAGVFYEQNPLVLPIATETPAAIFGLGSYAEVSERLAGLTWGAEDLPAAIGAATSREEDGRYTPPYELARSLCLFGAAAAGVAPIETVYPAFRDLDGLAAYAARARRDGFTGMMAIHPAQVAVINEAFTPSEAEIAHARAVVAAFEANPGAGALSLDGRMIDRPHLVQARRTLAAAD